MSDAIASDELFQFGGFTLDTRKGVLSRGNQAIYLRPKAYALLVHLARNTGRVVPKAELMDQVWPGIYVTEDSLTQSIREIRRELDDQELVRTVSRRGYMLVGQPAPPEATASQPIVAVLRFRNESGDPLREPLVDGFAEDVITGLAHYGSVTVLARNSSFSFPSHQPAAWADVASRIGADFLVEGSVRWSGKAALVSVSLVDAKALRQLWGHRYEAHDVELFAVQRDISVQIVNRLVSQLDEASLQRTALKPAQSLAAYELVTRGVAILRGHQHLEPEKALPLLELAVAKDPTYGVGFAYLALCKVMIGRFGEMDNEALNAVLAIAVHAAAISPTSAVAPRVMALLRIYLRQHAAAEADLRGALILNPYDADAVEQMGYLLAMRGRPLEALEWFDRAFRLNPIVPPWYNFDKAHACFGMGEYEAALDLLQRPAKRLIWQEARIAACYGHLGDRDGCWRQIDRIFAEDPNYPMLSIGQKSVHYEHEDDRRHLIEGLTLALGLAGRSAT